MNVADIVQHHASWHPDRLAVVCGVRRITYGQLADRIMRLASALAGCGIGRGSHVGVLSTNSAEYVEIVYALAELGATWVPINFRLAPPEIEFILQDSGAGFLFYSSNFEAVAIGLRDSFGSELTLFPLGQSTDGSYEALIQTARPTPRGILHADDPFALMYTSGTTGRPKGALLTHRQFLSGTYYFSAAIGAVPQDRKLQAIPQFHAGGAIYQMAYMLAGATIVVLPVFDPGAALMLMREEGVTAAGFVPAMLNAVSDVSANRNVSLPSLRQIMYGGSSISSAALARAMDLFPVDFIQTYGQTEAGVIVTVLDSEAHRRARTRGNEHLFGSCGRALLGYDVRLLGQTGFDSANGELCVRSDAVMTGYWNRPEATATTIVDGWLRTGDVATLDNQGFYYIVDRKVDMIVSGGENVYALEVENVLADHPDIAEVAVVGVPDPRWGEVVLAVVASRGDHAITLEQMREHCRGRLGGFKVPKRVEIIDALPRNGSGKVLKYVLRSRFSA
jgi:acyl-CoA synthetase (AMP-forming)/AMP-acid ligase II